MSDIVFATSTCVVATDDLGTTIRLTLGDPWAAEDPFVKGHQALFSEDCPEGVLRRTVMAVASAPPKIERATKAPGEARGVRRGA